MTAREPASTAVARRGASRRSGKPPASRENTNVRSLALSLNQKKAMILSQDALNALRQAILEEPIAGVTYGRPPSPR